MTLLREMDLFVIMHTTISKYHTSDAAPLCSGCRPVITAFQHLSLRLLREKESHSIQRKIEPWHAEDNCLMSQILTVTSIARTTGTFFGEEDTIFGQAAPLSTLQPA